MRDILIKILSNLNKFINNFLLKLDATQPSKVPSDNLIKIFMLRTWNGVKKGIFTPTLPKEMLEFQRKPLIRILRVLGGISLLTLLGRSYFKLNGLVLYLSLFFVIIFFIYHIYISIHKYKHIKKILMTEELEIKNSPLDKYATLLARVILCGKGACEYASPVGVGLGLMLGADQVLKESGREAIFSPLIGAGLDKILPKNDLTIWKEKYNNAIKVAGDQGEEKQTIKELIGNTEAFKQLSFEDREEFLKALKQIQTTNAEDLATAKSQVIEVLKNKPKN
jgi:hypothetical protein